MDLATLIGWVSGFIAVIMGAIFVGLPPTKLFDIPSLFITFGGGFFASMAANDFGAVSSLMSVVRNALFTPKFNISGMIVTLVSFSEKARREGLLSLEDDLEELDEEFLKKGLQLVVDGTDPELVRRIMESELESQEERHATARKFFEDLGTITPAFGMIGTLIGLIQMLGNLEDKSAIGPGMSAALITTLYGSFGANLFYIPLAAKLELRGKEESTMKRVMIEGTISIQSGDNPRIVRDKLAAFLKPADRTDLANLGER